MDQNIAVTYQGIHGVARQLNLGEGSAKEEGNTWSNLFTFNRTTSTGMTLNFKPPTIIDARTVVILEAPEIEKQTHKWNNALVVSSFGEAPAFSYMRNYIARYWKVVVEPELYYHDDGFYISLPATENESLGQLFVVSRSSPILDFSNSLEITEQISKIGLKCMPSPNIGSGTRGHGSRIEFALDTRGIPRTDDQDILNGDGRDLGGTHLGRIVGFYTANALATILGQTGDWDVLVVGVVVAAIKGIGMLMYKKPPSLSSRRLQSLVSMVNYWKNGIILGI
ncbi:putative vacuolar amino acid transporter 1-like [Capsicum annuum]|nr:putative vacuolar amino acid transporter 1-like [Capsicum annuum]